MSTDLVAELRAEVTRWWELTCKHRREQEAASTSASQTSQLLSSTSSVITPILGAMLVEGPVRMITLGQELSVDVDEKTLAEMQFKDSQVTAVLCLSLLLDCYTTNCTATTNTTTTTTTTTIRVSALVCMRSFRW